MPFARTVQTLDGKDGKTDHYKTVKEISHGGLESVLKDVVPVRWRCNLVRDLVAWLATPKTERIKVELPEGLSTWEEIEERWDRLIRRWL